MLDPVPWLVSTPGVQHSAEVARTLAYSATNGATGVIGSSSFKVAQQGTPNNTVRVLPGVASVVSNYPGHSGQSYILRNATSTNVTIAPTSSAAGRTDAIIARVDDIGLVGQVPADVNSYNYTKIEVIQGVSAGLKYGMDLKLNYPFVLLAKITLPVSTATITSAMITDLREVVNPREKVISRDQPWFTESRVDMVGTGAYPVGQYWPRTDSREDTAIEMVRIPEWATRVEIEGNWLGVYVSAGTHAGNMWATMDSVIQNTPRDATQYYTWTAEDTATRQNWFVRDTRLIPADMRGKDAYFSLRARKASSAGTVFMDRASGYTMRLRFQEAAD